MAEQQGFTLIENYIKEFGQQVDSRIVTGQNIHDTRTYNVSAGYSPGSVFRLDLAGAIYMTVYTGSKVAENFILPVQEDDSDSYRDVNECLVRSIRRLANGQPLSAIQKKALTIASMAENKQDFIEIWEAGANEFIHLASTARHLETYKEIDEAVKGLKILIRKVADEGL